MMNFNNIWSLSNVRCSSFLDESAMILGFLWRWWVSTIFHDWPMSHVVFLFMKMTSFYNFSHNAEVEQYFVADEGSVFFFCGSKWNDFKMFLKMMNFNNIWSLTGDGGAFSLHKNQVIFEFLGKWWISRIFEHWGTSNGLFLFMIMISVSVVCHRECDRKLWWFVLFGWVFGCML